MGILDDAKDKFGEAADWVKDKAGDLGENAQAAGHAIGERAADAKHWVQSHVASDTNSATPADWVAQSDPSAEQEPVAEVPLADEATADVPTADVAPEDVPRTDEALLGDAPVEPAAPGEYTPRDV